MALTTALAPPEEGAPQPVERLQGVSYLSRVEVDDSPSRRDGVSAEQEAEWRAEYSAIISEAGMRLRIPQWAIYTATQLCHRFYAVRSMARNDRFLISAACLFLSAKLQEFPKRASDTAVACDHVRFYGSYEKAHAEWRARQQQRGEQPQRPRASAPGGAPPIPAPSPEDREPTRWWEDREHVQRRREELLVAERAVLFALNFAVATAHPYASLLRWVAELDWRHAARAWKRKKRQRQEEEEEEGEDGQGKEGQVVVRNSAAAAGGGGGGAAEGGGNDDDADDEEEEKRLAAALSRDVLHVAWNLVTDSARTQLGIMHHPSKIAAGALYAAALTQGTLPLPPLLKPLQEQPGGGVLVVAAEDGEDKGAFFRRYRLTSDELEDISTGMLVANEELTSKKGGLPLCLEFGGGGGEGEGGEGEAADGGAKRPRLLLEGAPAPLLLSNG